MSLSPLTDYRKLHTELCWAYADEPLHRGRQVIRNPPWNSAWFVERGSVRVTCGGHRVTVPAGAFALPPLAHRVQEFAPGTRLRSIGFIARWSSGWPLLDLRETVVITGRDAERLGAGARRLVRRLDPRGVGDREGLRSVRSTLQHLALQEAFQGWLGRLVEGVAAHGVICREPPSDPRVAAMIEALESWALDRPFSLPELARSLGMTPRRVQQIARAGLMTTPRAYLDRRRLEHAIRAIRAGADSMKEISARVGFAYEANFSLWFRRRRGQSPSEFRRRGLGL